MDTQLDISTAKEVTAPPRGFALFPIVTMCVGYAIVLFSHRVLNDADTYWHIATGMWILEHAAVPHADPFSYTLAGAPWVAHEWLSEVLMAVAYRAGRWSGIFVLFGAAAAVTCAVLARYLSRWLAQPAAAIIFVFAIACVGGSLLARPHLLALTALTLWTAGLMAAKDKDASPSVLLLPLMTIWANLHASFIFGLALALPIAFEAVMAAGPRRATMVRRWGVFLVTAIGASLITPNGWHGMVFPFQLIAMKINSNIAEWAPTNFQTFQPMEGGLIALLYVGFSRNVRLPIARLFVVIGLLYLSLAHARHQMLAGVVVAFFLAKPFGQAFRDMDEAANRDTSYTYSGWMLAGIACIALLTTVRMTHPLERIDDPVSPATALNHVPPKILNEPVFNSYSFGGYLIFRHVKPFIDGRADLYGDAYISAYLAALAPNRSAFARIVEKYGIRWAILESGSPAVDMIAALPHWRRLYGDNIAAVYVREPSSDETLRAPPNSDTQSDSLMKLQFQEMSPATRRN